MAPREVFTVAAIPAHQNDKGSHCQSPQDSQTSFASPAQALLSPQSFGSQGPVFRSDSAQTSSYPRPPSRDPKESNSGYQQAPQGDTGTSPLPASHPESLSAPQHTLPAVDANMSQGQYNPYAQPNVTPPAPAYGYPQQSSQPYGYPNPQPSPVPIMQAAPQPVQTVQPGPAPGMDIRNVKGIPRDANGEREWSHGCSECCDDCGTCFLGWCCPCVLYSQIQTRLKHLETRGTPHPEGGESCAGDCFVHGLLTCCLGWGFILQISQRQAARARYRIHGDACNDCMISYCCSPCEMTQVSREIELEERSIGGAPVMQPAPPIQSNAPAQYPEKH